MTYAGLLERLESGSPVLMDGAMSTELARRGLIFNEKEWLHINLDQPELVADVHASYARAGAELHIANSFATGKHVTQHYGFPQSFEALNRAAVELCRQAIDSAAQHPQWIAGSVSTYAPDHDRKKLPQLKTLEANCREQALILTDAGCDMIALEMIADADIGAAMLKGVAGAGLPISLGVICGRASDGTLSLQHRATAPESLTSGLSRMLANAPAEPALIVTIMHTDINDTLDALQEVQSVWPGKVAVYPHTGRPDGVGGWDVSNTCSAVDFANTCHTAAELGACFVGGCCGIGPTYIQQLANELSPQ